MALLTNPMSGVRTPDDNEQDDIGAILARMAGDEAPSLWPTFPTVAARNTAITVANGAKVGQKCSTLSPFQQWIITAISNNTISWQPFNTVVTRPGVTPAITGTNWDGVSQCMDYAFSAVATVTNNLGGFNVPLPIPASNGLLSAVMVIGDDYTNAQAALTINPVAGNHTLTQLNGVAFLQPIGGSLGFVPPQGAVRVECRVVVW